MSEKIEIGGLQIEVLRKKSLKNMYIRINPPEGDVVVSAPADATDEEIRLLVLKRMPDISKVRGRMNAQPVRVSGNMYPAKPSIYGANLTCCRSSMVEMAIKSKRSSPRL